MIRSVARVLISPQHLHFHRPPLRKSITINGVTNSYLLSHGSHRKTLAWRRRRRRDGGCASNIKLFCFVFFFPISAAYFLLIKSALELEGETAGNRKPRQSLSTAHPPHPHKNLIWRGGRGIRSCQAEFRLSRSPSTRHRIAHFIHD